MTDLQRLAVSRRRFLQMSAAAAVLDRTRTKIDAPRGDGPAPPPS